MGMENVSELSARLLEEYDLKKDSDWLCDLIIPVRFTNRKPKYLTDQFKVCEVDKTRIVKLKFCNILICFTPWRIFLKN
jgi:hypothetical protein